MRITKDILIDEITPCGYKVVLELLDVYQKGDDGYVKTDGGIIVAENEAKREAMQTQVAKVISIGEHAHKNLECGVNNHKEWGYEIGDYVLFNAYVGKTISTDPEDRRVIVNDHDIQAKVKLKE
jgi:co-chaperonin GroES (HSP10)